MEALAASTGKSESNLAGKPATSSVASKQSKTFAIMKGCVSDEVLFEAIALISMALGVHAIRVISGAGRGEDAEIHEEKESGGFDEDSGKSSICLDVSSLIRLV